MLGMLGNKRNSGTQQRGMVKNKISQEKPTLQKDNHKYNKLGRS